MERKYGLIGRGIEYSKSKWIFDNRFGIRKDLSYTIHDIGILDKDFLLKMNGFNVTTPYKVDIIKYLDSIDSLAEEIGSVNCVLNKDGKLIGYNTDYIGFDSLLRKNAKNILLLGNGGVAKMIRYYCKKNNIGLTIVGRKNSNEYKDITYEELNDYSKYDYIINATKFGILPPIDYKKVNRDTKIVDLSYINGDDYPIFIKEFLNNGHDEELVEDGFGMLVRQAFESYKIWGLNKISYKTPKYE